LFYNPLGTALGTGDVFAADIGCNSTSSTVTLSCMRNKSVEEILQVLQKPVLWPYSDAFFTWWPVSDGLALPKDSMLQSIQNKKFDTTVEMIIGSNLNEGTIFVLPIFPNGLTKVEYIMYLGNMFGNLSTEIQTLYPYDMYVDSRGAMVEVIGDYIITCQVNIFEQALRDVKVQPHSYIFTHVPSYFTEYGAYHTSEIPYVFNQLIPYSANVTQAELDLATQMMTFWTTFAKTGNPNYHDPNLQYWPVFDEREWRLILDAQLSVNDNYKREKCDFWKQVFLNPPASPNLHKLLQKL